jgi:hypothetical protein
MAIKVNNTEVITNSRNVANVGTLEMTGTYGPDVHPISTNVNSSTPALGAASQSQYFVTLPSNSTITVTDSQKGCLTEIILDTAGFTPTFDGADFYWSGDSEPSWSDFDIWRISLIGISSAACVAAAVAYDPTAGGTFIPISGTGVTPIGREASTGLKVADSSGDNYNDTSSSSMTNTVSTRFSRQLIGGVAGFQIDVNSDFGASGSAIGYPIVNSDWWDTSNVSSTLDNTYVTIYQNNSVVPTAIRMLWTETILFNGGPITLSNEVATTNGSSYSEGDWVSVSTTGDNILTSFTTTATAQTSTASSAITVRYDIEFWGRAAGYDDTLLGTYRIEVASSASTDAETFEP